MTELLPSLISSLQEELQQYGEMLALLDEQQELVMNRVVDHLQESISTVQEHGKILEAVRQKRQEIQSAVARRLGLEDDTSFAVLISKVPPNYQPMLQALIQENNELLFRVQQRARQNHLLLSRSVDLMQKFINSLISPGDAPVYGEHGQVYSRTPPAPRLYEAVG
jgi:flagellar biosynthesis/type III secretory pathway chaperone